MLGTFTRFTRLAIVIVGVVAIASVSFALAAVAASPGTAKAKSTTTISIATSGKLAGSSFGPGAIVTITYSCFPVFIGGGKGGGYSGFGSVSLGDIKGHQGFASFTPQCTDSKKTLAVFVPGPFVAGDAAASAFVCGFDCNGTSRE